MGKADKPYCDWNGEVISDDRYVLHIRDAVTGESTQLQLCATDYATWRDYFRQRMDAIRSAWSLNPTITKVTPK